MGKAKALKASSNLLPLLPGCKAAASPIASPIVEIQAAAFTEYLDNLSEADQREWQQALQQMLSPDQADAGAADSERLVYITPKGEVYHSTEQCASLSRSKTINSLTLGEAVTNGRRPCKICAGK